MRFSKGNLDIGVLIAVRGGSKRVPNKNIRSFAGSSLLEIKIEQAKRTGLPVYVSTEDDEMFDVAVNKCKVGGFKRDPFYASDTVPMGDVYRYMASIFPHEHVLYMPVTSPLLTDETVASCIGLYVYESEEGLDYDSVVTATSIREYLWDENLEKRKLIPINYDPTNHPRSQDLPNYFALNFAVNLLPRDTMIRKRNILGDRFTPVRIGKIEAIDIDEEEDFKIAELLFTEKEKNRTMFQTRIT